MKIIKSILVIILIFVFYSCSDNKSIVEKLSKQLKDDKLLHAVIIIKNDSVVFREFFNGKTEKDVNYIQSVTKSVMSILIGIAIDKKAIYNAEQSIAAYFPEIQEDSTKTKLAITIKHLLNQVSGLKSSLSEDTKEDSNQISSTKYILTAPLESTPGWVYRYNNLATHLLSVIVERATNMNTATYAETVLFKPLGISQYQWGRLSDGYFDGAGLNFAMRPDDMVKIGKLMLNNGNWNGRQIVSEDWVKQSFAKKNKLVAPWGLEGSLHGYCWYKAVYNGYMINYAFGSGGQYIFIISDLNAVIVITHALDNSNVIVDKFLTDFFPDVFDFTEKVKVKSKKKV